MQALDVGCFMLREFQTCRREHWSTSLVGTFQRHGSVLVNGLNVLGWLFCQSYLVQALRDRRVNAGMRRGGEEITQLPCT